jgi:hypothetical protein
VPRVALASDRAGADARALPAAAGDGRRVGARDVAHGGAPV